MKKRAQVTLFIILAVLIIAVIIVIFFVLREKSPKSFVPPKLQPINNFVMACLEETSNNALINIGEQGGYFFITSNTPSIENNIPYYLYNNQNLIPPIKTIEQSISGFIYEELSFCILNFKDFKNEYNISHELKSVETKINNDKVSISLDYPISVKIEDSVLALKDFAITLPIRLNTIYNSADEIINGQKQYKGEICLSCLYDIGEQNKIHIDMLDYENSTIFTIIDENSKINDESYNFIFAVK